MNTKQNNVAYKVGVWDIMLLIRNGINPKIDRNVGTIVRDPFEVVRLINMSVLDQSKEAVRARKATAKSGHN